MVKSKFLIIEKDEKPKIEEIDKTDASSLVGRDIDKIFEVKNEFKVVAKLVPVKSATQQKRTKKK
ncbi:MAG: hypothetical protein SVK08_00225 [Halobacteriota archaeon]|nr:hypothetical protein [Halobacteriota archaeon]